MGKRKWKRVNLRDLATVPVQERVLATQDQQKEPPGGDSPEKRPSEMLQVER